MKWLTGLSLWLALAPAAAMAQRVTQDAQTGAMTWTTALNGVHFSLTQILPAQADAFYVNRGFSESQIRAYSASCVFMAVLRNDTAPGPVHFVRSDWVAIINGENRHIDTVQQWVDRLAQQGVPQTALLAFRWAQFPPDQEYKPGGDWNQGMLSVGLPPKTQFDLRAQWDVAGEQHTATLKGVTCAQ